MGWCAGRNPSLALVIIVFILCLFLEIGGVILFLPLFFLVCSSMVICSLDSILVLVFLVSIYGYICCMCMLVVCWLFEFFSFCLPTLL